VKLSKAETRALKFMASARPAQDGVIDRYGRVVCNGEHRGIHPATWLRLVSKSCVAGSHGRLRLTTFGAMVADHD